MAPETVASHSLADVFGGARSVAADTTLAPEVGERLGMLKGDEVVYPCIPLLLIVVSRAIRTVKGNTSRLRSDRSRSGDTIVAAGTERCWPRRSSKATAIPVGYRSVAAKTCSHRGCGNPVLGFQSRRLLKGHWRRKGRRIDFRGTAPAVFDIVCSSNTSLRTLRPEEIESRRAQEAQRYTPRHLTSMSG